MHTRNLHDVAVHYPEGQYPEPERQIIPTDRLTSRSKRLYMYTGPSFNQFSWYLLLCYILGRNIAQE